MHPRRGRGRPGRGDGEREKHDHEITATGLCKSFGGTAVLGGIDLEVGAGTTTFSLLGPNDPGEASTVQIMSTRVHADGEVRVAGHDMAIGVAAVRAAIGVTGRFCAVGSLLIGEETRCGRLTGPGRRLAGVRSRSAS